jgi:hypothetical protein
MGIKIEIKEEILKKIARTTIRSKIKDEEKEINIDLSIKAIKQDKKIIIIKEKGKSIKESEYINGIILKKKLKGKKELKKVKMILCKMELGSLKSKIHGTKININNFNEIDEYSNFEIKKIEDFCKKLIEFGKK